MNYLNFTYIKTRWLLKCIVNVELNVLCNFDKGDINVINICSSFSFHGICFLIVCKFVLISYSSIFSNMSLI